THVQNAGWQDYVKEGEIAVNLKINGTY
ncbi:MAG: hypothetical protein LHW56_11530, partial [Candidatus Cloacimonetes bacterium]|nr:hypothetical protein [Candidatus Cloacimonadota bacterium]